MKPQTAFAILSAAFVGQGVAQNALPVTDNPKGVVYTATLPKERFFKDADIEGNVRGYISAVAGDDGKGVKFKVKFENLPKQGGPFTYHIHAAPTDNNNCTETLAHLDPFSRGADTPCDSTAPQTCEVGDLSGKYGKITSDPWEDEYTDLYASTKEGIGAFFGNRSFVLHYANKTRLTCANFQKDIPSNGTYPPPTASPTSKPTSRPTAIIAGAASNPISGTLMLAGLAVAAFAL